LKPAARNLRLNPVDSDKNLFVDLEKTPSLRKITIQKQDEQKVVFIGDAKQASHEFWLDGKLAIIVHLGRRAPKKTNKRKRGFSEEDAGKAEKRSRVVEVF
jgi:hypothetical protein